jgi:CheY-like chemotaxis protein
MHILIVEDDPHVAQVLLRTLQRAGYHTTLASNGMEGWTSAQTLHPDLMLIDLGLPIIDGWRLTQMLRHHPTTATIPVIALTGYSALAKGDWPGAEWNALLVKPFSIEEVVQVVAQWARGDASRTNRV